MIVGVGHDICRIDRIARIFDRYGERFVTRICTEAELAELALRADKPAYLAKRFAVKEAVYKALHQADQSDMRWHDAETLSSMHKAGAPQLTLSGGCRRAVDILVPEGHIPIFHISVSDDIPFASAFILIEARPS
ncbi:MAG: holo-ACP synthase [Pseudomonadota bacterium]|nr:holo-ACP synthase [Pseudomonadota bacterium]